MEENPRAFVLRESLLLAAFVLLVITGIVTVLLPELSPGEDEATQGRPDAGREATPAR